MTEKEMVPAEDFYQLLVLAVDLSSNVRERYDFRAPMDSTSQKVFRDSGLILAAAFPDGSFLSELQRRGVIHEPKESIVRMMETARRIREQVEKR